MTYRDVAMLMAGNPDRAESMGWMEMTENGDSLRNQLRSYFDAKCFAELCVCGNPQVGDYIVQKSNCSTCGFVCGNPTFCVIFSNVTYMFYKLD